MHFPKIAEDESFMFLLLPHLIARTFFILSAPFSRLHSRHFFLVNGKKWPAWCDYSDNRPGLSLPTTKEAFRWLKILFEETVHIEDEKRERMMKIRECHANRKQLPEALFSGENIFDCSAG